MIICNETKYFFTKPCFLLSVLFNCKTVCIDDHAFIVIKKKNYLEQYTLAWDYPHLNYLQLNILFTDSKICSQLTPIWEERFCKVSRSTSRMVLHSSTKCGIFKPCTNVQSHRIFDLDFWQTSKQIYRKLQYCM